MKDKEFFQKFLDPDTRAGKQPHAQNPSASSPIEDHLKVREVEFQDKVNLKDVITQHNIYSIHAMNVTLPDIVNVLGLEMSKEEYVNTLTTLGVGVNRNVRLDAPWQSKLDILLGFEPTISTSTIHKGDTADNMYFRMGVLLKEGNVIAANSGDMVTAVKGIKNRVVAPSFVNMPLERQIHSAVTDRRIDEWNELIIEDPKIAGFYVSLDKRSDAKEDIAPYAEIIGKTTELGMPLFVIKNGVVYEGIYTDKNGEPNLEAGREISPQEVLDTNFELNDDKRQELQTRGAKYLTNPPEELL